MTYIPKTFKSLVITLSDRASSGEYEDRSGPRLEELLAGIVSELNWKYHIERRIIPDNPDQLKDILLEAKNANTDFVFTTGGTGIGPKDITPDVVNSLLDKEIPGIMEMIRIKYGQNKPNALISRSVAGIMGQSIIFTLTVSEKAVNEYMEEIGKSLRHLILMLHGIDSH
jgi:molybdenum cofactor synthesis domain-containing protein